MSTPFSIEEYVRWSDVDAAGVICYGAYVRFIEIAETELFRTAGFPYGQIFERFDCWLPRVRYLLAQTIRCCSGCQRRFGLG